MSRQPQNPWQHTNRKMNSPAANLPWRSGTIQLIRYTRMNSARRSNAEVLYQQHVSQNHSTCQASPFMSIFLFSLVAPGHQSTASCCGLNSKGMEVCAFRNGSILSRKNPALVCHLSALYYNNSTVTAIHMESLLRGYFFVSLKWEHSYPLLLEGCFVKVSANLSVTMPGTCFRGFSFLLPCSATVRKHVLLPFPW